MQANAQIGSVCCIYMSLFILLIFMSASISTKFVLKTMIVSQKMFLSFLLQRRVCPTRVRMTASVTQTSTPPSGTRVGLYYLLLFFFFFPFFFYRSSSALHRRSSTSILPHYRGTFCAGVCPKSVFSFLVAAGFEPTSLSLRNGHIHRYTI